MPIDPQHEYLLLLGDAIRQVRVGRGFTVAELALASGVARERIGKLECGLLDPEFDLLIVLADALGVGPSTFVIRAEELREQGGG